MAQLQTTSVTGSLLVSTFVSASGTISGSNINASGNMTAGSFTGVGSGLTGLPAANITGILGQANGGTGVNGSTTLVNSRLLWKNGSGVISSFNEPTPSKGLVVEGAASTIVFTGIQNALVKIVADNDVASSQILDNGTQASVGGEIDAAYKFKVHGHLGVTGTVYETSTIKVKTNIETLTDEISKLLQVRPIEFDYIENGEHSYGFIAQELNEVYPDAVIKDDDGETIGVAYADLTSPIIRGIQQLHEKISQLEERIKTLEGN